MAYTFQGGIRMNEYKNTEGCPIEPITPPATVSVSMSQHIGAPCTPAVQVGDTVDKGQVIGRVEKGLGCPVHASVSGKVTKIALHQTADGRMVSYIDIENDFEDRISPEVRPFTQPLEETTSEQIVEVVRQAGISGMGGAAFPTYAKIQSAVGKADTLIVNGAECEPYITANHRLFLEQGENILNGVKILLRGVGIQEAIIAIEDNKPDAIAHMKTLTQDIPYIRVAVLKTKYPQGDERQLIYALKKVELPTGKLPADAGCVIFNAETCAAVYRAFATGMPLVERVMTCDGDCVREPKNIFVPIGTSYRDVIAFCGGLKKEPHKIIDGGPMMGMAQFSVDTTVKKSTSALLVFSDSDKKPQNAVCIRCGRCVQHCPMHLMPNYLAAFTRKADWDMLEQFDIMSCVECGTCSYGCPGYVPIVQYIKKAKGIIRERQQAMAQKLKENEVKKTAEPKAEKEGS